MWEMEFEVILRLPTSNGIERYFALFNIYPRILEHKRVTLLKFLVRPVSEFGLEIIKQLTGIKES
jgi:hypothetical protein